ncbi:MAG: YceI family protein [Ahrensia sp.]|nr:YceI family protein [Ahrensia sp.]
MNRSSFSLKSTAAALALTMAGAFGTHSAFAASYTIDPGHSFIKFGTGHLGIGTVQGRFNSFTGTLQYDPEKGPEAQQVTIVIDTTSLDTNHAERDKHLRSADFFNVDGFGEAKFESTKFEGDAKGGTLTGNLTFLGTTREISFPIVMTGEGNDPWGGYRVGFEGEYSLTRKDFGMDYQLGPAAEVVKVELFIEAIKDK